MSTPWPRETNLINSRAVGILVVICLVALAGAAATVVAPSLDLAIRDAVLAWESPALLAVMRVINHAGQWRLLFPATLLLLVVFERGRARWWVWTGLMIAAPLAEGLLKIALARPRPESLAPGFPSGHATAAAAYFGALFYLVGSVRSPVVCVVVRTAALVTVGLVALARILLRAHWPSDVLAGVALGLGFVCVAAFAARQPRVAPDA